MNKEVTFMIARPGEEPRPFVAYENDGTSVVAASIFSGQTYPILPWHDPATVETIVDIGANVGAASAWFRLHYPRSRIIAFEPHPRALELLARNAATFGFEIRPYGLWRETKRAMLREGVSECGSVTASLARHYTNTDETIPILLENATEKLGDLRVNILKIDTEGAEIPILSVIRYWTFDVIHVEIHSDADRRHLDNMMLPTHMLYSGTIYQPHKAELVYVRKAILPPEADEQAFVIEKD